MNKGPTFALCSGSCKVCDQPCLHCVQTANQTKTVTELGHLRLPLALLAKRRGHLFSIHTNKSLRCTRLQKFPKQTVHWGLLGGHHSHHPLLSVSSSISIGFFASLDFTEQNCKPPIHKHNKRFLLMVVKMHSVARSTLIKRMLYQTERCSLHA